MIFVIVINTHIIIGLFDSLGVIVGERRARDKSKILGFVGRKAFRPSCLLSMG